MEEEEEEPFLAVKEPVGGSCVAVLSLEEEDQWQEECKL